jgi:hypothetical protein
MKSNFSILGMLRANASATSFHHILGIVVHFTCRHFDHGLFALYTSGVYLAEGSTPFLHASWIMKSVGLGETVFFAANGTLIVLNFFIFRIMIPPFLLFHFVANSDSWLHYPAIHIMKPMAGITLLIFVMLNMMWFYTLIDLYVKGIRQVLLRKKAQ